MAADQGPGAPVQAPLSRTKLLEAIASLLAKKDEAYIEGFKQRARNNNLNLKGIQISEEMVVEALKSERTQDSAVLAGQRWQPGQVSAATLAAKAAEECEEAEPYNARVRVVGGQKLAVLPKPNCDILKDRTTESLEYLPANQWEDTCARVVNKKDGRVYVRLRNFNGWVSSRSRKEFSKVVLEVEDGKPELEPASTLIMSRSRVMRLVPPMTQEGQVVNEKDKTFTPVRFRSTLMVQILTHPDYQGAGGIKLNAKEEFLADGAFLRANDGRAYLHLKDGRGWICERSKTDFFKLAVEPCGPTEDFFDDEEPLPSLKRTRDGGKKVIVFEKSEALGDVVGSTEEPGAKDSSEDAPAIFRSDAELWPEEGMGGKPIKKALRLQLRRLYVQHGAKVKECNEDLKEVTDRAGTFGRSCPAKQELVQYADALKKEADKAKKAWTTAVKALLKENPLEDPPASVTTSSCVSPVQVRGGRWYCAMLRTETEESGSGWTRQCGPLRMSREEALEDSKRLQQAKDETLKRKAETSNEAEASEAGATAAPSKRSKTA